LYRLHRGALERENKQLQRRVKVGTYDFNAVDPHLETAWFQPLNLKCDILVSKFASKFNLYRYMRETFQALQGAHAVAEQTKRAAQEAVRAARREQIKAERALAIARKEAVEAGVSASDAKAAAAAAAEVGAVQGESSCVP
jgi:hypothetical protein